MLVVSLVNAVRSHQAVAAVLRALNISRSSAREAMTCAILFLTQTGDGLTNQKIPWRRNSFKS